MWAAIAVGLRPLRRARARCTPARRPPPCRGRPPRGAPPRPSGSGGPGSDRWPRPPQPPAGRKGTAKGHRQRWNETAATSGADEPCRLSLLTSPPIVAPTLTSCTTRTTRRLVPAKAVAHSATSTHDETARVSPVMTKSKTPALSFARLSLSTMAGVHSPSPACGLKNDTPAASSCGTAVSPRHVVAPHAPPRKTAALSPAVDRPASTGSEGRLAGPAVPGGTAARASPVPCPLPASATAAPGTSPDRPDVTADTAIAAAPPSSTGRRSRGKRPLESRRQAASAPASAFCRSSSASVCPPSAAK